MGMVPSVSVGTYMCMVVYVCKRLREREREREREGKCMTTK